MLWRAAQRRCSSVSAGPGAGLAGRRALGAARAPRARTL